MLNRCSVKRCFIALSFIASMLIMQVALASGKGIYINSSTAQNPKYLSYLIQQSKAVGIDTFVIDMERMNPSAVYKKNIKMVENAGIKFVARVVVFPAGGTPDVVRSKAYWAKRYQLVQNAIDLGASAIQLDYIRYNTKQPPIDQNSKDVLAVVKYFKERTAKAGVPLQMDVFGETSYKTSPRIGQDIKLLSSQIDVLCPMLYPSHVTPFDKTYVTPYETVLKPLQAIKARFNNNVPFKIHAYIELSNYHYKMSASQKIPYIKAQLKAVKDAGVAGWYAWSANNYYDVLFQVLKQKGGVPAPAH
jgi:hypothetical protein